MSRFLFTHFAMSRPCLGRATISVVQATDQLAAVLGRTILAERERRGWTLGDLARRSGVSPSGVRGVESGLRGSLEMYERLGHALGLRLEVALVDPRRRARPTGDVVHAAMSEAEATHLRALGYPLSVDEPYQHYQFAGRADVVSWSIPARALLHIENRTAFPDLQEAAGAYNAKRAYLAGVLAQRLGLHGGFRSQTHVMAGLWSAEVIHSARLRKATFLSLCPDDTTAFEGWWAGRPPRVGTTSAFVLFDPFAAGRQARWVGLEAALGSARPRVRGYAEAAERLGSGFRFVPR